MYEIKVSGLTCGGCVNSVTNAIKELDSKAVTSVNLATQIINVTSIYKQEEVASAIEEAGFSVLELKESK